MGHQRNLASTATGAILLLSVLLRAAAAQSPSFTVHNADGRFPEFIAAGQTLSAKVTAVSLSAARQMAIRLNGKDVTAFFKPGSDSRTFTAALPDLKTGRNILEVFPTKVSRVSVARLVISTAAGPQAACAELISKTVTLSPSDRVVIESAAPAAATQDLPAHCIVRGYANPHDGVKNSHFAIGFEVRLPDAWSGRFLFQGGGGNDGSVSNVVGANTGARGSPPALARGFAVAATDGGHNGRTAESFGFDQQARIDHAWNAYGKTVLIARALMTLYYGRGPDKSYVIGCSGGGRHAMMFSQRFPELFDGVVACAPAMRVASGATISAAWESKLYQAIAPIGADGAPVLSKAFSNEDLTLVSQAILKTCDGLDGAVDGEIDNHAACKFDPKVLECSGAKTAACLTHAQVTALADGFAGPHNSAGTPLYSAWPWDAGIADAGWRSWKIGSSPSARPNSAFVSLMQDALDNEFLTPARPGFSIFQFDFDRDPAAMEAESALYDAYRDDKLTAFKGHGGKLLFFHGMSDPIFSPYDTMDYYNRLAKNNGGLGETRKWARAFFIPGMTHCSGGPSNDVFDGLSAIIAWVENEVAPDRITSSGRAFPGRTRPLCAYPSQAHYSGTGNVEDAAGFVCQ